MSNWNFISIGLVSVAWLTATISSAATENVVQIPLKNIWAHGMPATRDIRELEPDIFGPKSRKLSSVFALLAIASVVAVSWRRRQPKRAGVILPVQSIARRRVMVRVDEHAMNAAFWIQS